ncbi:MAG: 23S rRNA (adenine(2503)-C(2))-methyltransferase RlmN [Bacilli bacterium]|nr:23S rRNA (adenine(2503)-C(2))-methyltransferase RlmN [Bacilli bacterium]
MESIYNKSFSDLEEYFESIGEKKYKASQVYEWLYGKRVESFDEFTNVKKDVVAKIKEDFSINRLVIEQVEKDVEVHKYLFELPDGNHIEAVLMMHDYGKSLCISSQVGCNMGCKFCESGRLKKVRNLDASEMVLQVLQIEKEINDRISHIVIMGIGEPFDNYDNVIKFVEIVNHAKGLQIGSRHITISTCGLVPKIKEFSSLPYQVNLAISLHAATNEVRNKIMPINKVYPIETLIESIKEYINKTNRRVTFEYIMLEGINDSKEDAINLCNLLKGINCYVNIIPYNETNNIGFKRSKKDTILQFYDIIKRRNIQVTIRREFGSNISAACGQLRAKKESE